MTTIMTVGAGIFFMRVGTHAQETLGAIVARKQGEIARVGHTFWGYGGNSCHPTTVVQPFARTISGTGRPLTLCMEEMVSERYFGEPLAAAEYSVDGRDWTAVPDDIQVLGSRYALVITNLRTERFTLPLDATRVAVGLASGRSGSRFVQGRVDKACLTVEAHDKQNDHASERQITLVADILPPYAVFLRNFR